MERVRPRVEDVKRIAVNNIIYPSDDFLEANFYGASATTLGSAVAIAEGFPWQLAVPFAATYWAFEVSSFLRFGDSDKQLTDYFRLSKAAIGRSKTLKDGSKIPAGETIVDIHLGGVDVKPWLRHKSPVKRGAIVAQAGIEGLRDLAYISRNLHPYLDGVNYIRARSYLVQPSFFEGIGFEVERNLKYRKTPLKKMAVHQYEKYVGHPISEYHEAWIRKERLVEAYEDLTKYKEQLSKFTKLKRVSIPFT